MLGRKPKQESGAGAVDGGQGRGVPLGGHDDRPPTGYLPADEEETGSVDGVPDEFWDDSDPADRRKDPLRQP